MHVSLFRSIAKSLAILALGLSVATTPAVARGGGRGGGSFHGGGGGFHGGFGDRGFRGGVADGGFRGRFADRGFRGRFGDRRFVGGFGGYYGYCGYPYGYPSYDYCLTYYPQRQTDRSSRARCKHIQIARRAAPITRRAEAQTAARVVCPRPVQPTPHPLSRETARGRVGRS